MAQSVGGQVGRILLRALTVGASAAARSLLRSPSSRTPTQPRRTARTAPSAPDPDGAYPGDFTGRAVIQYRPDPDGDADPGEVVWGWVPYEEDHRHGKDRPVLVIGKDAGWLLGLMLTSKDHDRDGAQEAREGRLWMDVGAGAWDSRGRPSEARLDRVVRLAPGAVRREGGTLERDVFDSVADEVRRVHGWR